MNTQQRIRNDIQAIGTYISEHGQETGTVSWQIAEQAHKEIEIFVEHSLSVLGNRELMVEFVATALRAGRTSVMDGICSGTSLDDAWVQTEAEKLVDEAFGENHLNQR